LISALANETRGPGSSLNLWFAQYLFDFLRQSLNNNVAAHIFNNPPLVAYRRPMSRRDRLVGTKFKTVGTFSNDDENVDDDVYDRFGPGTGPSSTAGNVNTLVNRLRGRVLNCGFLWQSKGKCRANFKCSVNLKMQKLSTKTI